MGTNEFQQAGDGGRRDAGDKDAGRLRDDSRFDPREREQVTNLDSARTNALEKNGPMSGWMSMTDDPQGFKDKTDKLLAQSPEQMAETIKANDEKAQAMKGLMAGLKARVDAVTKAKETQEALELKQRGQ